MKISIDTGDLANLTTTVAKALPQRPVIPALAGVKLTATPGQLAAAAYDYDLAVTTSCAADVGEPGDALVSGRLLSDIAKALPKERRATLHLDGPHLRLTVGSGRFALPVLPLSEYPTLPLAPPEVGALDGQELATAVAHVAAALGRDDTLPTLTGIYLEFDADTTRLTMTATDRYRFAVQHLPITLKPGATLPARPVRKENAEPRLPGILVPGRALAEAARLHGTGTVQMAADPHLLSLTSDTTSSSTRLLQGDFPRWRSILPHPDQVTCTLQADRGACLDTLKRVALVLPRNVPLRLRLDAAGQRLVFHAGTGDDAQAVDELPADITGDGGLELAFNPSYLADALGAFDDATIRAAFTTPTKPALFTSAADSGADASHMHVLMPVRQQ